LNKKKERDRLKDFRKIKTSNCYKMQDNRQNKEKFKTRREKNSKKNLNCKERLKKKKKEKNSKKDFGDNNN
jgi:hypothetical protein